MCLTAAGYDKQLIGRLRRLLSAFRSFWSLFEFMCVQIPDFLTVCTGVAVPYQGLSPTSWIEAHMNKREMRKESV